MFYDRTHLDNGVTVLSEKIDSVRSVAVGIWLAVGSRDERDPEAGMSHFLEHMMFKGTPTRSAQDISQTFDRMGAELNAFTSKEYTCYYARVLDQHVDTAMEVLSDMVSHSSMEESATTSEREVVLEEISRSEDTPDDSVHDHFAALLWPDHPLGKPVLGRRETVGGFDPAQSFAYMGEHYHTGNVVVAAAGNVDHGSLVDLSQSFLDLPGKPKSSRDEHAPMAPKCCDVIEKDTEQTHLVYGVAGLEARSEQRFALSILDAVLGGGMASRLFQEVREKRGLAYAVYSYHGLYLDSGVFAAYAGTRPSNTQEVLKVIKEEFDQVSEAGVTDEELDRAKESIKGQLVLGLENTRSRMTRLGKAEVTHGEILSMDELVRRVEAVTADDVRQVASELLGGPRVLAMIGPVSADSVAHLI